MSKTNPEYYGFQGKQLLIKTLTVPKEAVELLVWIEGHRKARELEMMVWAEQASHVRADIIAVLGLDPDNTHFDWDKLLADGKLRYAEFPKKKEAPAEEGKSES